MFKISERIFFFQSGQIKTGAGCTPLCSKGQLWHGHGPQVKSCGPILALDLVPGLFSWDIPEECTVFWKQNSGHCASYYSCKNKYYALSNCFAGLDHQNLGKGVKSYEILSNWQSNLTVCKYHTAPEFMYGSRAKSCRKLDITIFKATKSWISYVYF
jgi:hypothetical protein